MFLLKPHLYRKESDEDDVFSEEVDVGTEEVLVIDLVMSDGCVRKTRC